MSLSPILGDDLPGFAELVVEPLRRSVVAEVAVDDRWRPSVGGAVLVDPTTDAVMKDEQGEPPVVPSLRRSLDSALKSQS